MWVFEEMVQVLLSVIAAHCRHGQPANTIAYFASFHSTILIRTFIIPVNL